MKSAAARFSALASARLTALENAREASRLTIPGLIPIEGQNEHFTPTQPWQSVGADGVRTLSARLLMALFPTAVPFFRLEIDAGKAQALGAPKDDLDASLAQFSQSASALIEDMKVRPVMAEALRHLIIAGNVLVWLPIDGPPRLYRLDQYVVKRDQTGAFREIIVKEKVMPSTLPDAVREGLDKTESGKAEEPIEIYTVAIREGSKVRHWQEIKGKVLEGTEGESPAEATGWLPLRWLAIPGSDYGRSHVTEYIGDLLSLDDLSASINKFAAAASRIVYLVEPNSQIDADEYASANSGDVFYGSANDVTALQLDKSHDFAVVNSVIGAVTERVSRAFLIHNFRNAERVTAEEVRMQSEELENTLGGTYSVLADELQLPVANRYLYVASRKKLIPPMPDGIAPKVITGLSALGRAAEVNRLRAFIADAGAMMQSPVIQQYMNVTALLTRLGVQHGVSDLTGLLKSEEQMAQEQQQAMMAQAAQQAAPAIADAAIKAATTPEKGLND